MAAKPSSGMDMDFPATAPAVSDLQRLDTWTEYNENAAHEWGAPSQISFAPVVSAAPRVFGERPATSGSDSAAAVACAPSVTQDIHAPAAPVRYSPDAIQFITKETLARRAKLEQQDHLKSIPVAPSAVAMAAHRLPLTHMAVRAPVWPPFQLQEDAGSRGALSCSSTYDQLPQLPARGPQSLTSTCDHLPQQADALEISEVAMRTSLAKAALAAEHGIPARASRRRKQRQTAAAPPSDLDSTDRASDAVAADQHPQVNDDQLTTMLELDGPERAAGLAAIRGTVARRSFDPDGCRVVQLALKVAPHAVAAELASELRQRVRDGTASPHANYVIQKVVELLPTESSAFVVEELLTKGAATARHRFGCRIICRIFEHALGTPLSMQLADEVLSEAEELCRHSYARHVIHTILEHGTPTHRHSIARALQVQLPQGATHRNTSSVIERALTHCSDEDKTAIVQMLCVDGDEGIVALAQDHFGSHVLRAALRLSCEPSLRALEVVRESHAVLRKTKFGHRLLMDCLDVPQSEVVTAAVAA